MSEFAMRAIFPRLPLHPHAVIVAACNYDPHYE
jgi:hypothetical protein